MEVFGMPHSAHNVSVPTIWSATMEESWTKLTVDASARMDEQALPTNNVDELCQFVKMVDSGTQSFVVVLATRGVKMGAH